MVYIKYIIIYINLYMSINNIELYKFTRNIAVEMGREKYYVRQN